MMLIEPGHNMTVWPGLINKKASHSEGPEYCVYKTHHRPFRNATGFIVRFVCFFPIISCVKIECNCLPSKYFCAKSFKYMIQLMLTIVTLGFSAGSCNFAQVASRFDVLITEIFPDPSPSIGLPLNEFIEIKNVSATSYNLKDWKIADASSVATIAINYILPPDSIVIVCSNSAVPVFNLYGNTIGVSNFPSLDNDADLIFLKSKEGFIVHTVDYSKTWYQNDLKINGGWSLEMIDTKNPCAGVTNWKASIEHRGGTPGKTNSIAGNNKDDAAPALLRTYTIDSITIVAVFDEPIDSLGASEISKYALDKNSGKPTKALPTVPVLNEVVLKLAVPLIPGTVYTLTVTGIDDCAGNTIGTINQSKAGRPSLADTFDVVINELLFNPKIDGFDFIELYNKSRNIIDLQQLYLANRTVTGALANISQLSAAPYLLFPEEYLVFTENKNWLRQNYMVKNAGKLAELQSIPSLPDDQGTLAIVNTQGKNIDNIEYDSKWHFALLDNQEGISLERIDYSAPTQNKNNWTSAASTAGFGTPGYQNSQFKADPQMQGVISAHPGIFLPIMTALMIWLVSTIR